MTVVKINAIRVVDGAELERRIVGGVAQLVGVKGFLGHELLRSVDGGTYFSCVRWESEEDFREWLGRASGEVRSGSWRSGLELGSELMEFEVVDEAGLPRP
jgi:heme oxygenase (mycobilin-producing)